MASNKYTWLLLALQPLKVPLNNILFPDISIFNRLFIYNFIDNTVSLLILYHKYTETHHICIYFLILINFAIYFAKKVYLYTIIFLLHNPIFCTTHILQPYPT